MAATYLLIGTAVTHAAQPGFDELVKQVSHLRGSTRRQANERHPVRAHALFRRSMRVWVPAEGAVRKGSVKEGSGGPHTRIIDCCPIKLS
jgi:hypothetical protein